MLCPSLGGSGSRFSTYRLVQISGATSVAILCAARTHGLELVEAVCAKALQEKTMRAEVILNLIARALDPPAAEPVPTPDTLALQHEPMADCGRYDALRKEVEHATA